MSYYVDPHRRGDGHHGIDAMIDAVQERFPAYRFRLSSVVDAHNDRVRFTWETGGTNATASLSSACRQPSPSSAGDTPSGSPSGL